jgi:hypothetical protein
MTMSLKQSECLMRAALFLVLHGGGSARAQPIHSFVIEESLDRAYGPQLVSQEITVPEGVATPEMLSLKGPTGLLAVQASDVEYWPDGRTVKAATIHFVTDLRRLEKRAFTVGVAPGSGAEDTGATDLEVVERDGHVELTTSCFGMRFALGKQRFPQPVVATDVPAPVSSLRLADGTWCGGSEWYGTRRVVAYEAAVTGRGPVFGEVRLRYRFEDGVILDMRARLAAGDSMVDWSVRLSPYDAAAAAKQVMEPWPEETPLSPKEECLQAGWRLVLNRGLDDLTFGIRPEAGENRWGERKWLGDRFSDDVFNVATKDEPPGLLVNLVPWNDWWNSSTKTELTFSTPKRGEIMRTKTLDPADWVEPAPRGTLAIWASRRMRQQWIPLVRGDDGRVFLQFGLSPGNRRLLIGGAGQGLGRELDRIKGWALNWPSRHRGHPCLYMTMAELRTVQQRPINSAEVQKLISAAGRVPGTQPSAADNAAVGVWLLTGDRRAAAAVQLPQRLRAYLALFGDFDRMRSTFQLCGLYDAAMAGDLVPAEERPVLRARMAYLAHLIADAETWSMERGYCSGNLNMSVAHVLNQGIFACLLRDNPRAGEWADAGLHMLDLMLETNVGPAGEWPESVANYAFVSTSALLPLAIAARAARWDDFVDDPRMKRLLLYLAKQYTPPDPRGAENGEKSVSLLPPLGRGGGRGRNGLTGMMARATAASDPRYASALQWTWMRSGAPRLVPDFRLGGWEHVYLDTTVPTRNPGWTFDVFPRSDAIVRRGMGTPHEWYVAMAAAPYDAFCSEFGGLPVVFAKGAPIIARFAGGYAEREELFVNRVIPARPRGDKDFRMKHFYHDGTGAFTASAGLPGAAYLQGEFTVEKPHFITHEASAFDKMMNLPEWPEVATSADGPLRWKRQLIVQRDPDPAGPGTIFLRDSVSGGQPTSWQTWFISDGIVPSANQGAMSSRTRPPPIVPARRLAGDRFRAIGQFGVDSEVFVAEPRDTPRQTVRWGRSYDYTPLAGLQETMDLFHLQRADDGAYVVAIHPRRADESVPEFKSYADGKVVRVLGRFGVDYGFLADSDTDATADDVRFRGTAAVFSDRGSHTRITLLARGGVQAALHNPGMEEVPFEVAATASVEVMIAASEIVVSFPSVDGKASTRLSIPESWTLPENSDTCSVLREGDSVRINTELPCPPLRFQQGRK